MSKVFPFENFVCDLFSVTVVDQVVLAPVSCPTKVYCTAVLVLRNGKFSRLREGMTHSFTSLKFRPLGNCY